MRLVHQQCTRRAGRHAHPVLLSLATLSFWACASQKAAEQAPVPVPARRPAQTSARPDQDRRIARLELSLMEKEAQVEDLQAQLDETRQEVVRAMAKLQTLATRAEAASGMAEAEVALQSLKAVPGQPQAPEAAQGTRLLNQSSAEFNRQNYGGALYLANQAKTQASAGRGRLSAGERGVQRPGETPFAVPIQLKALGRANVREIPGVGSRVAFALEQGDGVTGYSYLDEWVRVSDDAGRGGWILRSLVARP
jgi:uncharacterized coiled-coil protein SlyX